MITKEVQLGNKDKHKTEVSIFPAGQHSRFTLICFPAMGVRASYYTKFAECLQPCFNVVTSDWQGQGKSSVRASRHVDFGYEDLIQDVNILLSSVDDWFPGTDRIIVGHSLGGQIGSLFAARYTEGVAGLILITSCSVHYQGWQGWAKVKVQIAGHAFYPISRLVGYFPGTLIGFGGREARKMMKDWSHIALSGKFEPADATFDYETGLKKIRKPVLSISVENDFLASKQAVKNLYGKFGKESSVTHLHLSSKETNVEKLNHFNWAKQPDYFGKIIRDWIEKKVNEPPI